MRPDASAFFLSLLQCVCVARLAAIYQGEEKMRERDCWMMNFTLSYQYPHHISGARSPATLDLDKQFEFDCLTLNKDRSNLEQRVHFSSNVPNFSYSRAQRCFVDIIEKWKLMHSDVMAHVTTWSNFAMALPIVQMGVMRQTAITDKRAATGARTILAIMTSAATITTTSMSLSNLPHQVSTGRQSFSTANNSLNFRLLGL